MEAHAVQGLTVTGEVNLTCDAWQAGNIDGYFAVTGHWIDETTPTQWELKNSLLGFTQLSNAHNGQRLGQALFEIIDQVGIAHKVELVDMYVTLRLLIHYRQVMLHVIMPQIILQLCRNWLYV